MNNLLLESQSISFAISRASIYILILISKYVTCLFESFLKQNVDLSSDDVYAMQFDFELIACAVVIFL